MAQKSWNMYVVMYDIVNSRLQLMLWYICMWYEAKYNILTSGVYKHYSVEHYKGMSAIIMGNNTYV